MLGPTKLQPRIGSRRFLAYELGKGQVMKVHIFQALNARERQLGCEGNNTRELEGKAVGRNRERKRRYFIGIEIVSV